MNINLSNKHLLHGVKSKETRTYRRLRTVHQEKVQAESSSQKTKDCLLTHKCNSATKKKKKTRLSLQYLDLDVWRKQQRYEQQRQLKERNQILTRFMRSKEGSGGLVSKTESCLDKAEEEKDLVRYSSRANSEALLFTPMSLAVWLSIFSMGTHKKKK